MKTIINNILIIGALGAFVCTAVQAEEINVAQKEGVTEAMQNLTENLDLLSAIKNAKRPIDVTALQTTLNSVIDVSDAEIHDLTEKLTGIANLHDDHATRKDEFLEQLTTFTDYYNSIRTEVNQDLERGEVVRLTQELKSWRETIYQPAISAIVDFTAVFENKNAITTANQRLIIILKDRKKIEGVLSRGKWVTFNQLLKKAQTAITRATQLNAKAQDLLLSSAEEKSEQGISDDTVSGLITTANQDIEEAYIHFLAMSKLIKK